MALAALWRPRSGPTNASAPCLVIFVLTLLPFIPFHSHLLLFFSTFKTDNGNRTHLSRTKAFHKIFWTAMASLQTMPYDLLLSIAQYLDLADIYALQLVRMDGFVPSDRAILNSCLSSDLQTYPLRDSHPTGLSKLGCQPPPTMPRAPAIRFQAPFRSIYGSTSGGGEPRSAAGTRLAHPHSAARCERVCARRGRSIKRCYQVIRRNGMGDKVEVLVQGGRNATERRS